MPELKIPKSTCKHINACEHFQYYRTLLNFPYTLFNLDEFTLESIIYNNCKILDKSRDWSLLLFKESLYIHRQRPELNHGCKASKELMIFYRYRISPCIYNSVILSSVIPDDNCKLGETLNQNENLFRSVHCSVFNNIKLLSGNRNCATRFCT